MRRVANIAIRGIFALFWCCTLAFGQISPGPLSQAHESLEGVTKCSQCHGLGGGTLGFKCLDCHTEIQRRISARTGYHARAYKASPSQTDCSRCHIEHNGKAFALIRLDPKTFNHTSETGFALEGKHRTQSCESCHNAKHIPIEAKADIKVSNLDHTFLGLKRECTNCHTDQHQGQLGTECVRCHSQDAWKPAAGFSHSSTAFPLTGQHQSAACQSCHGPKSSERTARYKGLSFSGCQNCHSDPHRGAFQDVKFKGSCDTCHNTSGWKNNQPSQNFNHGATDFPLAGKHEALACNQCHKGSDFSKPIKHAECRNCHEDPHNGQFLTRAAGSDCSSCHNESGFKPTLFTRDSHQASAFRLVGKHESLECSLCHQPAGKDAVYKLGKTQCAECHADPHQGEFASPPNNNRCENCHTQIAFKPATFTLDRHTKTRFPLEGSHAAVACYDCHKPLPQKVPSVTSTAAKFLAAKVEPNAARKYHFESRGCSACHMDPHEISSEYGTTCETCHIPQKWNNLRPFDHKKETKFVLEGAHQQAMCIGCHKGVPAGGTAVASATKMVPGFSKIGNNCYWCHQDVHAGQFRANEPQKDCGACHVPVQWKFADSGPGSFNHDATRFPLDRAHQNLRCWRCHVEQGQVDGKVIRKYRGTPNECTQCH